MSGWFIQLICRNWFPVAVEQVRLIEKTILWKTEICTRVAGGENWGLRCKAEILNTTSHILAQLLGGGILWGWNNCCFKARYSSWLLERNYCFLVDWIPSRARFVSAYSRHESSGGGSQLTCHFWLITSLISHVCFNYTPVTSHSSSRFRLRFSLDIFSRSYIWSYCPRALHSACVSWQMHWIISI